MDFKNVSKNILIKKIQELEKKLEEKSDSKYERIFNAVEDIVVVINNKYEIEEINKSGLDFFKISEEETLGKKCYEVLCNTSSSSKYCPVNISMQTKKVSSTIKYEQISGTFFSIKTTPILDKNENPIKFIDVLRDVTKEKKINEEHLKTKKSLQKAEKIAKIGHWEFHLDKNYVKASEGARRIYGLPINKEFLSIPEVQKIPIRPDRLKLDYALQKLIKNNEEYNIHFKIKRKNDEKIRHIHSMAEYNKENNVVFGIIKDVTDIKASEEKLKEQNEEYFKLNKKYLEQNKQLQKAKEKAEESDRLKTAFLHNVSHEFRTPMNAIMGFSDLLISDNINEKYREKYTDAIKKSCNRLLKVVENTVELSKIKSNSVIFNKTSFKLEDIIKLIIDYFRPKCIAENLELRIEKKYDPELEIFSDKEKLKTIISNILDNSIKFTSQGFIKFKISVIEDRLNVSIADKGIGISKENLKRITEPFTQIELDYTRNFDGAGNGLALAQSYIKLLNGRLYINSALNQGTVVNFFVPVEVKNSEHKKQKNINTMKNKNILVAEDEHLNFIYIREVIKKLNMNVFHAKNGKEAIDILKNNNIDLVLMDLKMPVMDGYEAITEIKKINKEIPVIAQSAYNTDKDIKKINEHNFNDFISKPINYNILINTIKKYFKE